MRIRYGKATAVQPLRSQSHGKKFFCLRCFISENGFAAIRTKAKYSHATLNDVVMAAYAHVIARRQSIEQVIISCPTDFRRFHPMSVTFIDQLSRCFLLKKWKTEGVLKSPFFEDTAVSGRHRHVLFYPGPL